LVLAISVGVLPSSQAVAKNLALGPLVQVSGEQVSGFSPFSTCTVDDVPNQIGQNYAGSAVEPWIVVNPANPQNLVGSWQQDRWSNGGARGLVSGVSFDDGGTWNVAPIPGFTLCTGGSFERASDTWLSFGPTGTLYSIGIAFDSDPASSDSENTGPNAVLSNISTDGGETWSTPQTLIEDSTSGAFDDKEMITADPTDAAAVYAVWDRLEPRGTSDFAGPSYFTRSTDGGNSWAAARPIFDPGLNNQTIGNQIAVFPDGTLIDVFTLIRNTATRSIVTAALLRSTDKGQTWRPRRPIKATRMFPSSLFSIGGVYDPESIDLVRTGDSLSALAVDPESGNLYLVWQDARWSNHGRFSDPAQLIDEIAFSMSTDGGQQWSKAIKINKTPTNIPLGNRQAFTPSIQVAADGTIGVTYYDFRFNDPAPDLKTDYFAVHCSPGPGTLCTDPNNWRDEVRLTTESFDMRQAPQTDGGFFVGDYEVLAAAGTGFVPFFAQATSVTGPSDVFARGLSLGGEP